MNKKKNKALIQLFSHLEGIVVAPTIVTLSDNKIIDSLIKMKKISLNSISKSQNVQIGYINIALNTLASLGIVEKIFKNDDTLYILTKYGESFLSFRQSYSFYNQLKNSLNNFIINDIQKNDLDKYLNILSEHLDEQLAQLKNLYLGEDELMHKIAQHIEGVILYPLVLYISHHGDNTPETISIKKIIKKILSQNSSANVDETYNYIISRAKSYGVTASYQPIFSNLENIIFNNDNLIYSRDIHEKEIHVNRKLNVWGSGGAHKTYFKKIDSIVIDIFNAPIENQPEGIADMGCGDGMFLNHLYSLILENTLRGKHLKEFPLTLIAADLNQEALDVASKNLSSSKIDCNFLIADISNPNRYKNDLMKNFNIDIKNLFHVRSFLDHNRIYKKVNQIVDINYSTKCAYAYRGEHISSNQIISNLIHHFNQWKDHISKHGLLLLELHGLDPKLSASNKSMTPTIAYEATHGYSDQFILEHEVFLKCAKSAGLEIIDKHSKVFPSEELTTISLNIFK